MRARRHLTLLLAGLLAGLALWQLGEAAFIHAKARLAQHLIAWAWERTLTGETSVRPWPWADTWPVARLVVPSAREDLFILAHAAGRSLAFGPGHLDGTAMPGSSGRSVVSGHRDTHFAFLQDLKPGDVLRLQTVDGFWHEYRAETGQILDSRRERIRLDPIHGSELMLVTCWPFDALVPGGPYRYLVPATATADPPSGGELLLGAQRNRDGVDHRGDANDALHRLAAGAERDRFLLMGVDATTAAVDGGNREAP